MLNQVGSSEGPELLLQGAIAIAMHERPDFDSKAVLETCQGYADTIRHRVRGSQPQALLAHLHQFLFEEEGFCGNSDDFYNPINSYLPCVLKTKRGLPISLSLLYSIIAQRLGLKSWGVGVPGHFLAGVEVDGKSLLVDAFDRGRLVTPEEVHNRLREIFGPEVGWSQELLMPTSNRRWLTRILQNLLNIFGSAGRYRDVAAMLELEIVLWPDQARLQRDLALVLARIGMASPAAAWLSFYLKKHPDDPQSDELKQLLHVLAA